MLLAYESKFQILLDSYRRKSENNLRKLEEVLLELLLEPTDRNNHTCPIKSCDQKQTHSSNKIKSRQKYCFGNQLATPYNAHRDQILFWNS